MWEIRTVTADEVDLYRSRLARGFGEDPETDEAGIERFSAVFEPDRMFGVFDRSDLVGTGGAFSLGVTVPGGATVPMGGTTMVTVQPTHRRQGILRELMGRHLDEVADRGEPIAGLWASESTIYGRFGYGPATVRYQVEVNAARVNIDSDSPGDMRLLDAGEEAKILPDVYESVRSERPGMLTRSREWWESRILANRRSQGGDMSRPRHVVHEHSGKADGYAIYRQKGKWQEWVADGEVSVVEVITAGSESHRAVWAFLTNIDLFPRVTWWNAPVDDPLSLIVDDSRRVRRSLSDSLWIRVLNVPSALEARSYEHDGVIVLGLHDATRSRSEGTYQLEVAGSQSSCEPSDAPPDVELDISVLGHLYLGGGNAVAMAGAGRIDGHPDAITTLHRLFRTDRAPWCPEAF
ncbi:MAG TPA: GNAT family N-acetyltransferase [Acidimicrobiia bacterium]|jgi:predicted acetyltransferase|nr:GNAT family N-acetyltransferase [Acidimicrobiia bacterium]